MKANERETERERKRKSAREIATRERIMNRLFISFSSVKLLRMTRLRVPRYHFHHHVMYKYNMSRVSSRGNTSCFVVCHNPGSALVTVVFVFVTLNVITENIFIFIKLFSYPLFLIREI